MNEDGSLNYTRLPNDMKIWLNPVAEKKYYRDEEFTVKVGRRYESAITVPISDNIPFSDGLQDMLQSNHLNPSDWMAAKTFIAEHVWLLKEGCIGYIDTWSIDNALLLEEYFEGYLSYDLYRTGNIDHVEDFEASIAWMMGKNEISTDSDLLDYCIEAPTQASNYSLPNWEERFLPNGDQSYGMIHILQNHTKQGRVRNLIETGNQRRLGERPEDIVVKQLQITPDNYKVIEAAILKKLNSRSDFTKDFTKRELDVIGCVLININRKSLFSQHMSELDIRSVIRNAYHNARNGGSIQQSVNLKDRINLYGRERDDRPRKLYQGNHNGLIVHLWILTDTNEIDTAYPVRKE